MEKKASKWIKDAHMLLGWFKKTRFWGNQLLFDFLNLYVEKETRESCGLYDDI